MHELVDLAEYPRSGRRATFMNIKLFDDLVDEELIARYEASLYYALKTKNLTFCDEQLYESESMMELNDASKEVIIALPLSKQDE